MSNHSPLFLFALTEMRRANALFNAVKKQYGLHTHLLRLTLPSPSPAPVPVPALLPRLPPISLQDGASKPGDSQASNSSIRMCEADIQETARFVREFVTMSLLPWMEKCVVDWNEAVG